MVASLMESADAHNRQIDDSWALFNSGDPAAVVEYFSLVLSESPYPDGFTNAHKIAFVPESTDVPQVRFAICAPTPRCSRRW